MNDEAKDMDLRLNAARIAAPYLHSKPQPEGRKISFALPDNIATAEGLTQVHLTVLKAVSEGDLSLDEGKELSTLLENQRRIFCRLIKELGRNKRAVCRAYAEGERRGLVHGDKNASRLTAEEYAEALWADGERKGWF